MAVETLTTPRTDLPNSYVNVTPREIDFVTRFSRNWDTLQTLLGITRPIAKQPGSKLVQYITNVTLQDGAVGPGNVIPYSKVTTEAAGFEDLSIKKYAKAVPIEDVEKYGATVAIQKSDDAFLAELQNTVVDDFITLLKTRSPQKTGISAPDMQMALATAKANVINYFQNSRKTVTDVVGFVNVMDFYKYLGAKDITVQTQFGLTYVQNFLGYSTIFLMGSEDIPANEVYALPVENIDLYYIDPANSEFKELGLDYVVSGDTNLIGFHAQGAYHTAVGESYAIMGMKLWFELVDGVVGVGISETSGEG